MHAAQMTLAAALRDAAHADASVRGEGVRNLAPALLAELRRPGPARCDDADHPDMPRVRAALLAALDDGLPDVRGHAALGLAMLGQDELVDRVAPWLGIDGDDEPSRWLRQTAVIALGHLGSTTGARPLLHARVRDHVRAAWRSPHDDVRFQAALALVDVDDPDAESELASALGRERNPELRDQLVVALAHLPRLSSAGCDRLAELLRDPDEAAAPIGLEAALVLAAHDRSEGGARLVAALALRPERDRALEALAALGSRAPGEAIAAAGRLAFRPWVPSITRVRAAYALVRMAAASSGPGERARRVLRRWTWHPRAAVREAVADAERALVQLGSLDDRPSPPP
jgi:HEAT repeat protein